MTTEMEDIENALTNIFLPKLLEWNVSVDELRQKVGEEIQKILNIEITFFNSLRSKRVATFQK